MKKPYVGQVIGRWTILSLVIDHRTGRKKALCKCACGTERAVHFYSLQRDSQSCGCLKIEIRRKSSAQPTHIRERLEAGSVSVSNGCIEWMLTRDRDGYGMIKVGGKMRGAHRVAYEIHKREIPEGLQLDHLCRNRACINPEHLEPVTNRENQMRGRAPGVLVHLSGRCAAGHEMTGSNVYVDHGGKRYCRECRRVTSRMHMRRKRAQPLQDLRA